MIRPAVSILAAVWSLAAPACAADWIFHVSGFGGTMTGNPWEEVVFTPWAIELRDPVLFGAAAGAETELGARIFFGIEPMILRHVYADQHLETVVPFTLRYAPDNGLGPLRSVGVALGLSYASTRPEVEIERLGQTSRTLIYWHVEAEFGAANASFSPFLRLHHRSDGFGLIPTDAGSNALVLGLRHRF